MELTQAEIDAYKDAVGSQAMQAQEAVDAMMAAMYERTTGDHYYWNERRIREYALQVMGDVLSVYGGNAGEIAATFFENATGLDGRLYEGIDWAYVVSKVRYLTKLISDNDAEGFRKALADSANFYVRRNAYENMVENCKHHGVRYARVPQGVETCAFCWMLASRGYVYYSEETAMRAHGKHKNCDCIIVPEGKYDSIANYPMEELQRRYEAVRDSAGVTPGENGRENRNAILRAIRKRNWEWLYTGQGPEFRNEG